MIDPGQTGITRRVGVVGRFEFDLPDFRKAAVVVDEVHHAAADATDGGYFELAGTDRLFEQVGAHCLRAGHGIRRVPDPEADVANPRPVGDIRAVSEARGLGVDGDPNIALLPQRDLLGPVIADMPEPHRMQRSGQRFRLGTARGELDELDAFNRNARRHVGNVDFQARSRPPHLIHQVDQRPVAVRRDRSGPAAPKLIVENLQRQRAVVSGRGDGAHEVDDRQIALAGHVPEMARPVKQVHLDGWRIGQLHEEDLVARDAPDRVRFDFPRQGVETVDDQADVRVVGAAHHLPRVAVIVDVRTPGQRLVADPQAALGRPLAEFVKIRGGAVDAAHGIRRNAGTDQH